MARAMRSSWRIRREADRITLACYCGFLGKGEKSLPWLVIVTASMVTDWVPMGRIRCPLRAALTSLFLCDYSTRGNFFVDLRVVGYPNLREPLEW